MVLAMFLSNISLSENDRLRAKEAGVLVFDAHDLSYYESLTSHIGPQQHFNFWRTCFPEKRCLALR